MLQIRPATIDDVPLLPTMIRDLAGFERQLDLCTIEDDDLARNGFGAYSKFLEFLAGWNEKAIGLYKSLGAELLHQWRPVLLSRDAPRHLAETAL